MRNKLLFFIFSLLLALPGLAQKKKYDADLFNGKWKTTAIFFTNDPEFRKDMDADTVIISKKVLSQVKTSVDSLGMLFAALMLDLPSKIYLFNHSDERYRFGNALPLDGSGSYSVYKNDKELKLFHSSGGSVTTDTYQYSFTGNKSELELELIDKENGLTIRLKKVS